jgi:hypothetical protein
MEEKIKITIAKNTQHGKITILFGKFHHFGKLLTFYLMQFNPIG